MPDTAPAPGTVLACFYRGASFADEAVSIATCRPGQGWGNVPSHCALIVSELGGECFDPDVPQFYGDWYDYAHLYEMTTRGWVKRRPTADDFAWVYPVALPDLPACRVWCGHNRGRYRWWVDLVIGLMALRLVRHRRVGPFFAHWHLAYRHICSLDTLAALKAGGWIAPAWLRGQDCPASPNDLLLAVRETKK